MNPITKSLKAHYEQTFSKHGACSKGVDWGIDSDVTLRYHNMLAIINDEEVYAPSILDVGCGFGGLYEYARSCGVEIEYTGIDIAANMIQYAKEKYPACTFLNGDVMSCDFNKEYDYVICNGILTQKLEYSILEMDKFANSLIKIMFKLSRRGIAFNIMSNKVNFMVSNLYYRSPVEVLAFCLDNLSHKVIVDHSYPLFEYTVYVYKELPR